MILINLLPYREERRQRRKTAFFIGVGLSVALGAVLVGLGILWLQHQTRGQEQRNQFLGTEISRLESQIKDIANLRAEIDSLKARQRAVEDLQTDRNTPVHLLNELTRHAPEGIYLTAIRQQDKVITLTGMAQTNERVSEFMRNVTRSSDWLDKPDLIEVKLANVSASTRDQKRLFEFSMRVTIRSEQPDAQGLAASGAQPAPQSASAPVTRS